MNALLLRGGQAAWGTMIFLSVSCLLAVAFTTGSRGLWLLQDGPVTSWGFLATGHEDNAADLKEACGLCAYRVARRANRRPGQVVMSFHNFTGYGRTGNYIMGIRRAFRRAHECKAWLTLPSEDRFLHAFSPAPGWTTFDFTSRPGQAHRNCTDVEGDNARFFLLHGLPSEREEDAAVFALYRTDMEQKKVNSCVRQYMGLCKPGYCSNYTSLGDTLVAHVRQGDIFGFNVQPMYGQPPLSYYLRAFSFKAWKEIWVVSQDTDELKEKASPVMLALRLMNETQAVGYRLRFVSNSVDEDMRLLMCAPNRLESFSTMNEGLYLGFGQRIFTYSCFKAALNHSAVYAVPLFNGSYTPYQVFNNSDKQLLEMVFKRSGEPKLCGEHSSLVIGHSIHTFGDIN